MPASASPAPRVALIADTDSRWKWGVATAKKLGEIELLYYLIETPGTPNERQLREARVDPQAVVRVTIAGLRDALAESRPDIALVALPGGACQSVLHVMAAVPDPERPIIITGYVGVVYEKIIEGLLLRAGSDIVLANSPHDARTFADSYRTYGADPASVVISPLPYLTARSKPRGENARYTVTFAAQPSVPPSESERAYVVQRLITHARQHPERDVILKLRSLPGERVTHPEPFPYPKLAEAHDAPANFSLVGGPMADVLARTDLMLTVSSTAAMEAVKAGIPTGILSDFGIGDQLGTTFYAGSGCLTSFEEVDHGAAPVADPNWAHDHGLGDIGHDELRERVNQLLQARPLPPLQPFYSLRSAPYYLPRLLASYGVAPDGTALPGARAAGPVRRLTRRMAHLLYRVGSQAVAPLLRKLGSI